MKTLLVIGSGAREHALAWKLAQSPEVARIYVAPGNGGTAQESKCTNVELAATDIPALVAFARREQVDLAVIGPEAPLVAGIVDALLEIGIPAFGPSGAAARLEGSKAFARRFMSRHGIPTPRYRIFDDYASARAYLQAVPYPVVIKADGLAAGKGVIVPDTLEEAEAGLHKIMVEGAFGEAGSRVVVEERLFGREVSVLAFSDGESWALMPLAEDHKPVYDGDRGPNTGGMGAYAPAPLLSSEQLAAVEREILVPTIAAMRDEGTPYRGVLYAGLMITAAGPQVLEFNCRFGDPETEVILPLLESDLLAIMQDCVGGRLQPGQIRWSRGAAACVIAASGGYPVAYEKGLPIRGVDEAAALPGVHIFHAGTARNEHGTLLTAGGRVLAVTATGSDRQEALSRAYEAIARISFAGMHYRRDIGRRSGPLPVAREEEG
ncbi:MAG: phosphoribosylamine--glycine ligase [Caldilineae bacterium]|nr:MAG: phosphoribosylamine--glycine ligase [Caldilineae bacterium]